MLVFDVLNDGVPTTIIVDLITVPRSIDDVESESHTILLDHMTDGFDFGRTPDCIGGVHSSFAIYEVRRKKSVDQCALSKSGLPCNESIEGAPILTNKDHVELKAAFEHLPLDLRRDTVET